MIKKKYTKKMTLGKFIEEMIHGWGFYNPYHVSNLGHILEGAFRNHDELLSKEVEVTYLSGNYGWGTDFKYWYDWVVQEFVPPQDVVDYHSKIVEWRNGFRIGYER